MLLCPKTRTISVLCIAAVITVLALSFVPTASSSNIGPKSPGPGITLSSIPIDASAGGTDNQVEYTISVTSEADVTETVTLSINESDPDCDYDKVRGASFSDNDFDLAVGATTNVTLTLTIIYGTTPGNYTIKVDGHATWLEWLPPDYAYTVCYADVSSTITPYAAPIALPEFNMIGLMGLIGIVSVVLATVMRKRE